MHSWEEPEIHQIQTLNQANQNDWPKETRKKCPILSDSSYHEGATLSLSPAMCLSTHTVSFSLLMNTSLVSLLSIFVGILFLQSRRARSLSLTTGLVAGIWCCHHHDPTSISAREPKPASSHRCRPRPPEIRLRAP